MVSCVAGEWWGLGSVLPQFLYVMYCFSGCKLPVRRQHFIFSATLTLDHSGPQRPMKKKQRKAVKDAKQKLGMLMVGIIPHCEKSGLSSCCMYYLGRVHYDPRHTFCVFLKKKETHPKGRNQLFSSRSRTSALCSLSG